MKISNPIPIQEGDPNYPSALLNLASTIPVQTMGISGNSTAGTLPMHRSDTRSNLSHQALGNEFAIGKNTPSVVNNICQQNEAPIYSLAPLSQSVTQANSNLAAIESQNIKRIGTNGSRTELGPTGETLHVFHHVRPPRNVIQCRVEMLDGAFYHVQLPVR